MNWHDQARCKGITNFTDYARDLRATYCEGCPVIVQCKDAGLYDIEATFVAQLSKKERTKLPKPPKPPKTHCCNGHRWVKGQLRCKVCHSESRRRRRIERALEDAA